MAIEKYIAAASLGLFIIFSAEIITIYNFMQDAPDESVFYILEPDPKILQFISIGVAPAIIMSSVSFIIVKRQGSRIIGSLIITGGIVLFVGMIFAHSLIGGIDSTYESGFIPIITPLFIIVSVPVIIMGTLLIRCKKQRHKKRYV